MKRTYKIFVLSFIIIFGSNHSVYADSNSQAKNCDSKLKIQIKSHILGQIDALSKADWQKAYNLAAVSFQKAVPIESFKEIIKNQYSFLILNNGLNFGVCRASKDKFTQIVKVSYEGKQHVLFYELTLVNKRLGVIGANEILTTDSLAA